MFMRRSIAQCENSRITAASSLLVAVVTGKDARHRFHLAGEAWPGMRSGWGCQASARLVRPTTEATTGTVWPGIRGTLARRIARLDWLAPRPLGVQPATMSTTCMLHAELAWIVPERPRPARLAVLSGCRTTPSRSSCFPVCHHRPFFGFNLFNFDPETPT